MARTMQTARPWRPRHRSPPPPARLRGVPALATYVAPVFDVRKKTLRSYKVEAQEKPLRSRKIEWESIPLTTKEDQQQEPQEDLQEKAFNFLDLPAELRIKIYEMCVSVTEYVTYDERDHCVCGDKHISKLHTDPDYICKYVVPYSECFDRRLPGCYYPIAPDYVKSGYYDVPREERLKSVITPKPNILLANSQIRNEALPIFYAMNDFVFEDCDHEWVTRWIWNVVRPEHLKYIKSISWDGPMNHHCLDPDMLDMLDSGGLMMQLSSIVMLMQLGFLGQCKIRFTLEFHKYMHFACVLQRKILKLVERKGLTQADAENEDGKLDADEVRGLVFCVSKKMAEWYKGHLQEFEARHGDGTFNYGRDDSSYCDCSEAANKHAATPWITKAPLPCAFESRQDTFVVEDV